MRGVAVEPSPSWEPACMEPDELELFRSGKSRACVDCTEDFAASMAREGRCNGIPGEIAQTELIPLLEMLEGPDGRSPILRPDGSRRPFKSARKEPPVEQPTRLPRPIPSSPAVDALRELAIASEAAAETRTALDAAITANDAAQERLQAAIAELAPKRIAKAPRPKAPDAKPRSTEERQAAALQAVNPELTPRQQQILDMTVAYDGDRMAVANTLGVTYQAVDETLYRVAGKGKLPANILAKMPERFQQLVKESATHDESSG